MDAKDIMSKTFNMTLRGYKINEVEDFLREVALAFAALQKEKEDLEKRLDELNIQIREG